MTVQSDNERRRPETAGESSVTETMESAQTTGTAGTEVTDEQGGLERKMSARHLTMISLGGVIGTGLFLSSGYTIHQAGPFGAILAYGIGSLLVYFIMLSLGELSVAMPYAGSFHLYAKRFIGPGTAFTIAVLYWLNWAVALASEFTAAGLLMQRWFPDSPAWIWSAVFIVVVFLLNILSVRLYGESEFWFASIKVIAIIAFIAVGLFAIFGIIPIKGYSHAPLFGNFVSEGLLPNGIIPIFSTLLTVVFAFSGTEVVGVAAGETKDPQKAIPKAVHTTVLRLAIFFIGSIAVMSALIPWQKAGVDTSPFVLVFQSIGMPFAGDIMNFVVLFAVLFSMAGSLLALLSSVVAASTVYLALVAVSGLATLVVWASVSVCHMLFRKRWISEGHSVSELRYKAPGYPFVPIAAIVMCVGALVLVVLDPSQRSTLLYMIPFVALCYVAYYASEAWRRRRNGKR